MLVPGVGAHDPPLVVVLDHGWPVDEVDGAIGEGWELLLDGVELVELKEYFVNFDNLLVLPRYSRHQRLAMPAPLW